MKRFLVKTDFVFAATEYLRGLRYNGDQIGDAVLLAWEEMGLIEFVEDGAVISGRGEVR